MQYFDGGPADQPAVICAVYDRVPVAVTGEIWNAVQAVGRGARGGGTAGAGMPVTASPAAAFIAAGSDYVQLAGGSWGPGRLVRAGNRGWAWQPEILFDSEAFRDRDAWTGRDGAMDLRLRVAARIPAVVTGLRVTTAGRARMLEALGDNGLLPMMTRLAAWFGFGPGIMTWTETPEPAGRNNSRWASYQVCVTGPDGRPAVSGSLWFMLPTGVAGDIHATADLRISFDAVRPDPSPADDGPAQIPAELKITGPELASFLAHAWQVTTAVLPICAAADPADLVPAGPPHLELYIQNERRPNSGPGRHVRTLDMIDLSEYGQPRQDPPGDLSVSVTAPLGLPGDKIEALILSALDHMTEDFGFTLPAPSRA